MKLAMRQASLLVVIASLAFLPGCGRKGGEYVEDDALETISTETPVAPALPTPPVVADPDPSPLGGGDSPLSFSVHEVGGSAIFQTTEIDTDNVLRVRYEVGPAGNQYFDGTDVRVEITVNGSTKIPRYTTDPDCSPQGCEYGRPSDGASEIMDFSSVITPGVPITIQITNARYNWYCYVFYNPHQDCTYYNLVKNPNSSISFPGHYWEGRLIVQTHNTSAVEFESADP